MSTILKGIDLPSKNQTIFVEIFPNGKCAVMKTEKGECYELTTKGEAKAIQIDRPHGRIGDLDGVIKQIDKSPTFASKYKGTAKLFIDVYSDSNTILEAEENQ